MGASGYVEGVIRTLAIENCRSLRSIVLELGELTVITGANGSGKSSVYRALRLLASVARDGAAAALAAEGGMPSVLSATPRSKGVVSLHLGFASDDFGYAVDLGLPQKVMPTLFELDPELKAEAVWSGQFLKPANTLVDRHGPSVRIRDERRFLAAARAPAQAVRQHPEPARRPAADPGAARPARPDAGMAVLRPPPHRQRGTRPDAAGRLAHAGAGG